MRRFVTPLVHGAVGALVFASLTACSDPCKTLPPADAQTREVVGGGLEVEREYKDTECELQPNGRWEKDSD